ncbi:MAG: type 4a pilus biogenesis protein PilO [Planctomycetota bacterium]
MTRNTHLMLGSGLAFIAIAALVLLLVPSWRSTGDAADEIDQYERELASPSAGPEAIAELRSRLDLLIEIGDDRITPIPDEPDLAGLMRRMSEMFSTGGLAPPQLTTGVPQEDVGAIAMPMSISAQGGFLPLVDAIGAIESLPRLVRVRRVRLANDGSRGSGPVDRSGLVRADLQLDVFYAPFDVAEADER